MTNRAAQFSLHLPPAMMRAYALSAQSHMHCLRSAQYLLFTGAAVVVTVAAIQCQQLHTMHSQLLLTLLLVLLDVWLLIHKLRRLRWITTRFLKQLAKRVTYHWVLRYLQSMKMRSGDLELPELPRSLHPAPMAARFDRNWQREQLLGRRSLAHALFWTFSRELVVCTLLRLLVQLKDLWQPVAVARIVQILGNAAVGGTPPAFQNCASALLLYLALGVGGGILEQNQIDMRDRIELSMRNTLSCALHQAHTVNDKRHASVGRLALEARKLDTDLFSCGSQCSQLLAKNAAQLTNTLWTPFRLTAGLFIFYCHVGWAVAPGIAAALLYLPLRKRLLISINNAKDRAAKATSKRVSLLTHLLDNIVSIRMLGWSSILVDRIQAVRVSEELDPTIDTSVLSTVLLSVWSACRTCGPLVLLFIYCVATSFLAHGQKVLTNSLPLVTAESVFLVQTILRELIPLLIDSPHAFDSWWAAKRPYAQIRAILVEASAYSEARDCDSSQSPIGAALEKNLKSDIAVQISDSSFVWTTVNDLRNTDAYPDSAPFILECASLCIRKGQFLAVVGSVGSGKSSLLAAILGEMELRSSSARNRSMSLVDGRIAYVSQTPWLMNGTVRENITFGAAYDSQWFRTATDLCELRHDLDCWPLGDQTIVGSNGMAISGGQRMRVALARAVYSRASIYLLDDVLAAVDVHVSRRLIRRVLAGPSSVLRNATRIVVTRDQSLLSAADSICALTNGCVLQEDSSLCSAPATALFADILPDNREPSLDVNNADHLLSCPQSNVSGNGDTSQSEQLSATHGQAAELVSIRYMLRICGKAIVAAHCATVAAQCVSSYKAQLWLSKPIPTASVSSDLSVLRTPMLVHFAACAAWWAADVVLDLVAKWWTEVIWRRVIFTKSHNELLLAVANAHLSLFTRLSTGQLLSLFTQSQQDLDSRLPSQLALLATFAVKLLFETWIIASFHPLLLVSVFAAVLAMWLIARLSTNPLQHIVAMHAKALPLIDEQFQESVAGAVTIRAFEAGHFVRQKLMHRMACCARLQWICDGVETWTDLTMTVLRECTIAVAFAIALFGAATQSPNLKIDPATLLLVHISVTMHLGRLQHLIRQTHPLRSSLARAAQYINATLIPQAEVALSTAPNIVSKCWPSCGLIVFNRVSASYSNVEKTKNPHNGCLPPMVLQNVSFTIYPGQHVGIVGRTGSGKTSIAMALLGLLRPTHGRILIDNVDISHVPLDTLRGKLGIVPQSTYVFPGTVRENLDPRNQFSDNQIQHSLDLVGLGNVDFGSTDVDTWSAGQRQLLGLARAILKQVRILILDEATAFLNAENSQHLHMVIRRCFKNCTVITIAHRIESVLDCDSVMVVSSGTICESGAPSDLAACASSVFGQMMQKAVLSVGVCPPTPPYLAQ
ncbi:hypothetical protein H4R24_004830 [Coemansia sp. RSA 988]|nr:hypothetical protein H4R24_004830 [Coemansia sp. RSA 988]